METKDIRGSSETIPRNNEKHDCPRCSRNFVSEEALRMHQASTAHRGPNDKDWVCDTCTFFTTTEQGIIAHMDAKSHWGLEEEEEPWICDTCPLLFVTEPAATNHMDSLSHWGSGEGADQDYSPKGGVRAIKCNACAREFVNEQAVEQHMNAVQHWNKSEHKCEPCEQTFSHANALKSVRFPPACRTMLIHSLKHLNSRKHRQATVTCPFCSRTFRSASAVSQHLEGRGCENARHYINREVIYRSVSRRDPQKRITKGNACTSEPRATEDCRSQKSGSYDCHLCRNTYSKLKELSLHLGVKHPPKQYHCPGSSCHREFAFLASTFSHLESETCGHATFDQVNERVWQFFDHKQIIQI